MENKGGSTLCSVLSIRGLLSTAGSVSVTPFPPSTSTSFLHIAPLSLAGCGPRYQARADVRGPAGAGAGGGGRRRRLIVPGELPQHRLWEPPAQPTSTRWPRTSTTKTHAAPAGLPPSHPPTIRSLAGLQSVIVCVLHAT